jgi:hypothetical protein
MPPKNPNSFPILAAFKLLISNIFAFTYTCCFGISNALIIEVKV